MNLALSLVMLLSGAATLVLEIVWIRELGLSLGRTYGALVTVSAAFLAGLAGGALIAHRLVQARGGLVRTHLIAGSLALIFPTLVAGFDSALDALAGTVPAGSRLFCLVAYPAAGLAILVPAVLLGLALPLVLRLAGPRPRAGWYSGLSALGGSAGALAVSFVLLPSLGTAAAGRAGGILAMLAAAVAAFAPAEEAQVARSGRADAAAEEAQQARSGRAGAESGAEPGRVAYGLLALVALVGALGMLLELSWVRYFTLVIGSTSFALGLILAAFIGGSALGALAADRSLARAGAALGGLRTPGGAAAVAGVAVLALLYPLGRLPLWTIHLHAAALSFGVQQAALFGVAALTMLVPAMALGAVFPFAVATARAPRRIGWLVAAGTAGSVAGTFLWGGVVMPVLGLQRTLAAAALGLIGSGTAWGSGRLVGLAAAGAALGIVQLAIPVWSPAVMSAGAFHYAPIYAAKAATMGGDVEAAVQSFGKVIAASDGPDAMVAVRQQPDGTRSLVMDGKADASTLGDMRTQRLLGHLPGMLHPRGRALVIGLGSGVTAGSLLDYRFERVDVVELVGRVTQVAPLFSADSRAPLTDPRTYLTVGDARTFVNRTRDTYDVITSEPTNPWVAGAAALFTQEFFERCRSRLSPDGLMCQWVPAYHQNPEDFRAILAAFHNAFPYATLWESTAGLDYLLIGGPLPIPVSMHAFEAALQEREIAADLAEVEIRDATDVLARFVCGPPGLDALTAGITPVTDDRMGLEFTGPRARQEQRGGREIANRVRRQQTDVTGLLADAPPGLSLDIQDRWLKEEALTALRDGKVTTAEDLLVRASQRSLRHGTRPTFLKGFFLASVRERAARQDLAGAASELARLETLLPGDPDLINERGQLLLRQGDLAGARAIYEELTNRAPNNPHAWRNLAQTALMSEDRLTTIRAARRALALVPHEPEVAQLLARTLYQQGNLREAYENYTRALTLDPASLESRIGLSVVASALGREEEGNL